MEDGEIIGLYHQRNEQAIQESDQKYGYMCRGIAKNILYTREDAEECVNDTWYAAWIRMPPDKPQSWGRFWGVLHEICRLAAGGAYMPKSAAAVWKFCCLNWMNVFRTRT